MTTASAAGLAKAFPAEDSEEVVAWQVQGGTYIALRKSEYNGWGVYIAVADPTTRRQALTSPNAEQWQKAMQDEIDTITRKSQLASLPPERIAQPVKSVSQCSRPSSMLKVSSLASRLEWWPGFKEIDPRSRLTLQE